MLFDKKQQQTPFANDNLFLSSDSFPQGDIAKIAHGHDNVSIRMLKICGSSFCKRQEMIFKQCIETGVFPSEWKKGNIVPTHKKRDKHTNITQC